MAARRGYPGRNALPPGTQEVARVVDFKPVAAPYSSSSFARSSLMRITLSRADRWSDAARNALNQLQAAMLVQLLSPPLLLTTVQLLRLPLRNIWRVPVSHGGHHTERCPVEGSRQLSISGALRWKGAPPYQVGPLLRREKVRCP